MIKRIATELLLEGTADSSCRAVVVLPARNEEASLPFALDALARQIDLNGEPLPMQTFEVLLLLNNCTDNSAVVAQRWQSEHRDVNLHCFERELIAESSYIGPVRRLLMDTAMSRLQGERERCAILSTDADSCVAPDWIAKNLLAIGRGADAVGGLVELIHEDFQALSEPVQDAYTSDRRYQNLIAEMEDLFDPQIGDPHPRHLQHFGASLACTPEIYAHVGGMPGVAQLEDVAFVDLLRRVDATLRHDPEVIVWTSGRLDGRVMSGLSSQLRQWQRLHRQGTSHCVPTSAWLRHRFCSLRSLRCYYTSGSEEELEKWPEVTRSEIERARERANGVGEFLFLVDCDRLIEDTFAGKRMDKIDLVNEELAKCLATERRARATTARMASGATLQNVESVLVSSSAG